VTDENANAQPPSEAPPRWQPIDAVERRVAGALVEKAKTTPDAYPMSLNAIRNACNQKSNRFPVMSLEPEEVEEALQRLRELGAVGLIEGYGRVTKYRHYLYEWLAVDKVELAVMAELLLRGPQTEGELRGRAARMEPIGDLGQLRPVLGALKAKGLIIPLTPEGRGHVVTHALYPPDQLENIKAQYGRAPRVESRPVVQASQRPAVTEQAAAASPPDAGPPVDAGVVDALRGEIGELRSQLAQLRSDLEEVSAGQQRIEDELRELKDLLGG